MELSSLRALLALLRESGVTEYEEVNGDVRLKLGPAKPDQPAASTSPDKSVAPRQSLHDAAKAVSPALAEAVHRMPPGYAQHFTANAKPE